MALYSLNNFTFQVEWNIQGVDKGPYLANFLMKFVFLNLDFHFIYAYSNETAI